MISNIGTRRSSRGIAPAPVAVELTEEDIQLFGGPRCLCYGGNRREIPEYSDFFFCSQCDNAEHTKAATGRWPDLNSVRNKCTASHASWFQPTQRKQKSTKLYRGHKEGHNDTDGTTDDDGGGGDNDDTPPITMLAIHKCEGGPTSLAKHELSELKRRDWKRSAEDDDRFDFIDFLEEEYECRGLVVPEDADVELMVTELSAQVEAETELRELLARLGHLGV